MAFGQQSGPPATARQVQELLALLCEAGHTDFRDARLRALADAIDADIGTAVESAA